MFFRPTLFLEIARSSGMIQTSKSTLLWPLIPINPEKQNQNQFNYTNSQKDAKKDMELTKDSYT